MKRPEKEAVVAQLTEQFRNADAVYLTEYRGLTVPQISELREKLGRDTSYTVAKNTLVRIAAKEAGIEGLDELLAGPTAVTFVKGDFIEAAKTLRDFAKTNKALIIKGGFADGTVYDAEGAQKLADRGCYQAGGHDVPSAAALQVRRRPQGHDRQGRVPVQRSADQGRAYDRCAAREAGKGCLISLRLAA